MAGGMARNAGPDEEPPSSFFLSFIKAFAAPRFPHERFETAPKPEA
jgi:hypothetical protein